MIKAFGGLRRAGKKTPNPELGPPRGQFLNVLSTRSIKQQIPPSCGLLVAGVTHPVTALFAPDTRFPPSPPKVVQV